MLIGSTAYFTIVWIALIVWGLSIIVLAVGGLLKRKWVLVAVACCIAVGGILFCQALVGLVSD